MAADGKRSGQIEVISSRSHLVCALSCLLSMYCSLLERTGGMGARWSKEAPNSDQMHSGESLLHLRRPEVRPGSQRTGEGHLN
jgi:hypothetical protein